MSSSIWARALNLLVPVSALGGASAGLPPKRGDLRKFMASIKEGVQASVWLSCRWGRLQVKGTWLSCRQRRLQVNAWGSPVRVVATKSLQSKGHQSNRALQWSTATTNPHRWKGINQWDHCWAADASASSQQGCRWPHKGILDQCQLAADSQWIQLEQTQGVD